MPLPVTKDIDVGWLAQPFTNYPLSPDIQSERLGLGFQAQPFYIFNYILAPDWGTFPDPPWPSLTGPFDIWYVISPFPLTEPDWPNAPMKNYNPWR